MATRAAVEARLVARAAEDEGFRRQLLGDDPAAAIAAELGAPVPDGLRVRVIEEGVDEVVLVLPATAVATRELSDEQLEAAVGGTVHLPPTAWA
jgi:actin-like ATPase involved in cell morphogenesis